jgi:hypothetical protein
MEKLAHCFIIQRWGPCFILQHWQSLHVRISINYIEVLGKANILVLHLSLTKIEFQLQILVENKAQRPMMRPHEFWGISSYLSTAIA